MKFVAKTVAWRLLAILTAGNVRAADFVTLHDFNGDDGNGPRATLMLYGGILYGTTLTGGTDGHGTVFAINVNGAGFSTLHNFTGSDGSDPQVGVVMYGNKLYGTTPEGGYQGGGAVYQLNANGTDFTNIHSFTNLSDGVEPDAALTVVGNTLYGMAMSGGSVNAGALFKLDIDGGGFTNLHSFNGGDGQFPLAGFLVRGDTLYGPTTLGGVLSLGSSGTLFKIRTNGTGFTNIYFFGDTYSSAYGLTNNDGANPPGVLVLAGDTLYGATSGGGFFGQGTIFAVNTDGTGFTNLHNFEQGPTAGMVLSGNQLYGTTPGGGAYGDGAIFTINTNGTGFTNLYSFSPADFSGSAYTNNDGYFPRGGLVLSGRTLFGTTEEGGRFGFGTVFAFTIRPRLEVHWYGRAVVLSWNDSTFSLQAAPTVSGIYTNVPNATSPYTISSTALQRFFRLQGL